MNQVGVSNDPAQLVKGVCRAAITGAAISPDLCLGILETLEEIAWPANFRCTALDAETGGLVSRLNTDSLSPAEFVVVFSAPTLDPVDLEPARLSDVSADISNAWNRHTFVGSRRQRSTPGLRHLDAHHRPIAGASHA